MKELTKFTLRGNEFVVSWRGFKREDGYGDHVASFCSGETVSIGVLGPILVEVWHA